MTQNGGAIPAPWKDNGSIPAPWKVDQQQQQQLNAKEIQPQGNVAAGDGNDDGKAGRKRAAADTVQKRRESVAAKRAKSRRGAEVDNSCSDDDEPAKNLNASAKLVNDDTMNITSSPPGVPMAHSTPLINNSAATNRSAFSVLQPMHPNQQPQPPMGHHYPPGHPGNYFFPPTPADSMFHQPHHPQNPYFMPWPRGGPAMGYGNPFMMGMGPSMGKMEPLDMDNRWTQLGGVDENFGMMWPGGFGQQKQPQRRETQRGKTAAKKTNNKANATDSGLGDDILDGSRASVNSILSTNNGSMDGSFANGANNMAPPPIALPLHPINSYETYCTVPGRLTLLSNLKKYRVSIAEIQRRLSPPECLNASILGGILRKAKNKDGGRLLREQLLTYGVELTSGRRKQGPLTCFSSLVEEEAAQIALDFSTINQKNYPNKEAATFALCDVQNAQDAFMCQRELYYASKFLNRMLDFHRADRSPVADMPMKHEELGAELGPEIQQGLTNYSLLTHGFGGRVVQTVLDSMLSVLNECSSIVNRNYPQGQGNIFTGQMGGGAAGPSDGF